MKEVKLVVDVRAGDFVISVGILLVFLAVFLVVFVSLRTEGDDRTGYIDCRAEGGTRCDCALSYLTPEAAAEACAHPEQGE